MMKFINVGSGLQFRTPFSIASTEVGSCISKFNLILHLKKLSHSLFQIL